MPPSASLLQPCTARIAGMSVEICRGGSRAAAVASGATPLAARGPPLAHARRPRCAWAPGPHLPWGPTSQARPLCSCVSVGSSLARSGSATSDGSSSHSSGSGSGPVNKKVQGLGEPLYSYLLQHTREPEVLRRLREETHGIHGGHMQISPEQGQFMGLLVELTGAARCIEVGVFTGYSSLAVALALPPNGRLVALDRDAGTMEVAKRYWKEAGVESKVDARLGPAAETLEHVLAEEGPGTFDFAFIDADKRAYQRYFELCLQLVRPGGLIAVDNVLFYGKVADEQVNDKATVALRAFNTAVLSDDRVTLSIVPVGDGMALCRKR